MEKIWREAAFVVAVSILVGCAQGDGQRDIHGTRVALSEWRDIPQQESAIQFAGDHQPKPVRWRYRLRDNGQMVNEMVEFGTPIHRPISAIFMEKVTAGAVFTQESTNYLKVKAVARSTFEKLLAHTGGIEVKDGRNRNGAFLYTVVDANGGRCFAAVQGLKRTLVGYVQNLPGERFQAFIRFVYCADISEDEILQVFGSFRPKLYGDE